MKAKAYNFTRLFIFTMLFFGIGSAANSQSKQPDNTIRITVKELHSMPVSQFINGKTNHVVSSCTVTAEVEKDVQEYKVDGQRIPEDLKTKLATAKPGETIIVERRIAIVDGKEKKLPALVYSVVAQ